MTDYIAKPFAPTQLLEVIKKYSNRMIETATPQLLKLTENSSDTILDKPYLEKFYGGDTEHAADMFEIFLTHTVYEIPELRMFMEKGDWEATRRLAHRIKPNFSMVGLTELEKKMLAIEKMVDLKEDTKTLMHFLEEVELRLKEAIPVLKLELQKMNLLNTQTP